MDIIIILVALVVLAFLYTVHLWRNTNEKLTYMLDSLDNDDFESDLKLLRDIEHITEYI